MMPLFQEEMALTAAAAGSWASARAASSAMARPRPACSRWQERWGRKGAMARLQAVGLTDRLGWGKSTGRRDGGLTQRGTGKRGKNAGGVRAGLNWGPDSIARSVHSAGAAAAY